MRGLRFAANGRASVAHVDAEVLRSDVADREARLDVAIVHHFDTGLPHTAGIKAIRESLSYVDQQKKIIKKLIIL